MKDIRKQRSRQIGEAIVALYRQGYRDRDRMADMVSVRKSTVSRIVNEIEESALVASHES
jgi:DNA-binding MarR family transcriptional regulator